MINLNLNFCLKTTKLTVHHMFYAFKFINIIRTGFMDVREAASVHFDITVNSSVKGDRHAQLRIHREKTLS